MAFSPALGYPNQVWACLKGCLQAVAAVTVVSTATSGTLVAAAASLQNGRDALTAWQVGTALSNEYENLSSLLTLPVVIDATTLGIVTARISAMRSMALALLALAPVPPLTGQSLTATGRVAFADPGLVEWMMSANIEAAPSGTAYTTFAASALAETTAWVNYQAALATQSLTYSGEAFDACERMVQACTLVSDEVAAIALDPNAVISNAWNTLVAVPALSRVAAAIYTDPTTELGQQTAIMRYVINSALVSVNTTLTNLQAPPPSQVATTTVRNGETLMDIANRALGDYTRWRDIATVNGLQPPYIVATPPSDGSAVIAWGQPIYLPTTTTSAAITAQVDYETGFLGTDLNYGPLSGDMPAWTGDFSTISGYSNLSLALGRRLLTTLGALMFHPDYGSRIPPEVGAIQAASTLPVLEAYTSSALLADPRVKDVSSVTASSGANFQVNVSGKVIPSGSQKAVDFNEVLPVS